MQPIRGDIHVAVDFEDAEKFTLREAIEWWKSVVQAGRSLGTVNTMETKYMNERWAHLVGVIATREGVPAGALSYFLGELATAETTAIELAQGAMDKIKLDE